MFLNDKTRNEIKNMLSNLKENVELAVFTQSIECRNCEDNRALMQEISELSDKITLKVYDIVSDSAMAEKYKIDKIPAIAVIGKEDYSIRFFGIPTGYEFMSLLEAIKLVSTGETQLSEEAKNYLKELAQEVHIQVFVTPTCPYCPRSVILAHQMAYISPKVKADMIEVTEFPHLGNKYGVQGVPLTVINEKYFAEGAAPDSMIISKIREAIK